MSKRYVSKFAVMLWAFVFCFGIAVNALAVVDGNEEVCVLKAEQEIDTHSYYFNQLSNLERCIYQSFIEHKDGFLNNEEFCSTIDEYDSYESINEQDYLNSVQRARLAYMYDDPECQIWFQNSEVYLQFWNDHVNLIVTPNPKTGQYADFNSRSIRIAIRFFEKKAETFVATLHGTDAEKLEQIYDWLTANVSYDSTKALPNARNAFGALLNRKAICSGYAYAYKYIADLAGLKVLYVTGYVPEGYHAWNLAYINGEWLLIDSCFGANSKIKNPKSHYFLVPSNTEVYEVDTRYFVYQ